VNPLEVGSAAPRTASVDRLSVLVVTPKAFLGGAERWLLSLLDHTDRLAPVVVLLEDGVLRDALEDRGIPTHLLSTGAGGADVAAAAARLVPLLRSVDPDVVLANGVKAATAALPAARLVGVPGVWVRHEDSFAATLGRLALRLADRTVVVGPPSDAERRHDPALVPPPVLAEPLPRDEALRALAGLGVPDDGLLRVGVLARLAPYKGIDTVLSALAAPEAQGWRLVVAGTPDPGAPGERDRLERLAADLGVAARVSWLGEVDAAGRLAGALDAVAVPTRAGEPGYPDGEGFGMTVVEAYAAGVGVLADPRTVPALDLPGYRDGAEAVDSTDPASVARALARLGDERHRTALGERARAVGARHPRPEAVADTVASVLAHACHRPGAGLADGPAMSVVTTVRDEAASLDDWLNDLVAQLREGEDGDEVVVVDGGSTDGTLDVLRAWAAREARVRLVEAPGAGISEGRNIGVRAARHDWIACTDAGCEPDPGWLEALRRAAAEGGTDLVTGVYRAGPLDGPPWTLALAAVSYPVPDELRRTTVLDRAYGRLLGRMYDAGLPTGRSVAFHRTAWAAAGGYPEELATAEDVVFGKRVLAAGAHAELAVDAAVTWDQRPTLAGNLRMFRGYGRGDGLSGDRQLVARNLARAASYTVAPVLWLAAPRTRGLLALGAAAYLSVPLRRAATGPRPVRSTALVPVMAAARDVAKAVGCLEGLARRRRAGR
jgi:glycosyltransferase involved in cell wall biosynthesis